jgi:hypothetical protein
MSASSDGSKKRKVEDYLPVGGKKQQYSCSYCAKVLCSLTIKSTARADGKSFRFLQNITGMPRVKCAECESFDLCMNCFAAGNEVAPHKNNHAYRVVDNIAFPTFHKDWTAEEELLLLEGIETYGVGNWRYNFAYS